MGIAIGMRLFMTGRALGHAANVVQSSGLRCRHDAKFSCGAFDATVSTQFGCDRIASNHRHHTIDCRGIGRMPFFSAGSQPFAKCDARHNLWNFSEHSRIGWIKFGRFQLQIVSNRRKDIGLTIKNRHKITASDVSQKWKYFVTNAIPQKERVCIAGIEKRFNPFDLTNSFGVGPSQIEDRVTEAGANRGQAIGARTSQQIDDHRLGPIIARVTKRSIRAEHCMPGRPRAGFKVRASFDDHHLGTKSGTNSFSDCSHAIRFGFGAGTQPVIDMHRSDVAT
jgi:hypothetical protein